MNKTATRALTILGTVAVVAGLLAGTMVPLFVGAASHREAILISNLPAADHTDVYVFRSPEAPNTVTIMANWWPFQEPEGGPTWYLFGDGARHSFHISNDGGATDDLRLDFVFRTEIRNPNTALLNTGPIASLDDPNWNIRQFYNVDLVVGANPPTRLASDVPVPPPNIGPKSTPTYDALANAAIRTFPVTGGTGRVFAGPRDDPFFIDLGSAFDLLTIRPGPPGNAGGGIDQIAGFNVNTIAIQLPVTAVARAVCNLGITNPPDPNCVIGVWSSYSIPNTVVINPDGTRTGQGALVQVSRMGNPLVNELVIPYSQKDRFNASQPPNDAQFLARVTNPEPAALLNALFGIAVPPAPRNDLVAIFLTGLQGLNQPPGVTASEMLRLNLAVPVSQNPCGLGGAVAANNPCTLGVLGGDSQGYPNGRRLADDVTDITLRAAAGGTPVSPTTGLVGGPNPFNVSPNNQLGDGVNVNERAFLTAFPYAASPHQGFDHVHHRFEPPTPVR